MTDEPEMPAVIQVDLGAIFVSLELSKSTWLVTSLAPGSRKISRHMVTGGDAAGLCACFTDLCKKAQARRGKLYPLVVIQEAGLDGFWIDRLLNREDWIESHVVAKRKRTALCLPTAATCRRGRRGKEWGVPFGVTHPT